MALSFAFGGETGTTYDDLKRRQALAQAMWAGGSRGTPKTAMEGLNSAAKSITGALLAKKLGGQIKNEQDEFGLMFKGALGGVGQPMGGGQPAGVPDGEMASFIRQGLVERGLPEHVADGFLMNFKDESGLDPGINERNPIVPGSRGGFGLAQWTGPRRVALEKFAQARGANISDPNLQMDFLVEELRGPESAAAQKILAAKDPGSAAAAIVNNFLRPAEEHRTRRAAAYTGGQGPDPMLMAMAADPRASDAQRSVLSMLMQQQVQASDPMRQLQMQNLQGQIDARQNPQMTPYQQAQIELEKEELARGGDVPTAFRALDAQARAAGLAPNTPEYQNFMLNGGGDPATFRALDMQARAAGFVPNTPDYANFMATRGAGLSAGASQTAKNVADIETGGQAAEAVAQGRAQGAANVEKAAELGEMQRNMSSLLTVVDQLDSLADDATYTIAGRARDEVNKQLGRDPSAGAIARAEYIAVVDNQVLPLLRQTFGAAFTAKEGDTLRATLGDPDKSPAEKKAVLRAFIAQKQRDLEARGGTMPKAAPLTSDDYKNLSDEELLERLRAQ